MYGTYKWNSLLFQRKEKEPRPGMFARQVLYHRATSTDPLTFILRQNLDTLPNLSISLESPASWVAGITSIYHLVLQFLIFLSLLLFETASHCVGHPGLELFSSSSDPVIQDPPALASQALKS